MTTRPKPVPPSRKGKGINQQIMLVALRDLSAGGRATKRQWREAVRDVWDVPSNRFFEVLSNFEKAGLIATDGAYVAMTQAGLDTFAGKSGMESEMESEME